jgi:lipoprotein-anchoring transpeptidase ErfK/SrfK
MYIFIKLSFFVFITLFFYYISKIDINSSQNALLHIEKSKNSFLSMIHTEHADYLHKLELERIAKAKALAEKIRKEKIRQEKIAKALAEKKRLARLERIRIAKEIKRKKVAALKRKRNKIVAKIDISQQKMKVYKGGKLIHKWKVSTGKKGFSTPTGMFRPTMMEKMHLSKQYNNAPMPYSVFFNGGIAIHGTKSVRRLGRRASHGCVRVRIPHAKQLYALVQKSGRDNSYIEIRK